MTADIAIQTAHLLTCKNSQKQRVKPDQAVWLYDLVSMIVPNTILEIGVYYGYTAAIFAQAAPTATIVTLGVHEWECKAARANLAQYKNISVVQSPSWEYYERETGTFDFIFVDGDHKQVRRDLPWWSRLNEGGLMLFHDYDSSCPPVKRALSEVEIAFRPADVKFINQHGLGMAGWYKNADDPEALL